MRFAWVTVLAFVRIATHPRALRAPLTLDEALEHVATWLSQDCAGVLEPGERHLASFGELSKAAQVRGPLVMDAHLAALAIDHGAVLCTADLDFARFPGLSWRNPLKAPAPASRSKP